MSGPKERKRAINATCINLLLKQIDNTRKNKLKRKHITIITINDWLIWYGWLDRIRNSWAERRKIKKKKLNQQLAQNRSRKQNKNTHMSYRCDQKWAAMICSFYVSSVNSFNSTFLGNFQMVINICAAHIIFSSYFSFSYFFQVLNQFSSFLLELKQKKSLLGNR